MNLTNKVHVARVINKEANIQSYCFSVATVQGDMFMYVLHVTGAVIQRQVRGRMPYSWAAAICQAKQKLSANLRRQGYTRGDLLDATAIRMPTVPAHDQAVLCS